MRTVRSSRPGYALTLVMVFVVLFLMVLGVAYRQIASVLRVETVRVQQSQRDQGSTAAVASGLTLLETGLPPSDPYACAVTVNTAIGPCSYLVTFTSNGSGSWTVQAAPLPSGEQVPTMPSMFAPASIP
jgi:hypothetical protein